MPGVGVGVGFLGRKEGAVALGVGALFDGMPRGRKAFPNGN
jgi:hypothetical protein